MTYCCETMKRRYGDLFDPVSGLPAVAGEPLRFCPWCGASLGLDAGVAAAAAAATTTAARPAAGVVKAADVDSAGAGAAKAASGDLAVYVDGACANNQAPGMQRGGWAAVFTDGRTFSGGDAATTNNRMELRAAIEALRQVPPGGRITVHSDSAYVVNAFLQNWFRGWEARGWRNVKGQPVENQDLWRQLRTEAEKRQVRWVKVKGHAGEELNELADSLAVAAIPRG